jgi:hypothetical protein
MISTQMKVRRYFIFFLIKGFWICKSNKIFPNIANPGPKNVGYTTSNPITTDYAKSKSSKNGRMMAKKWG